MANWQSKKEDSETLLRDMLDLVPDMISIQDAEMKIVYSNWKGLANVPPADRKLHTKCYRTYRGYEHVCPECHAVKVLETGEALHTEAELQNGGWVDLRVFPILNDHGEVEMFVEWVRDITLQKRAEKELYEMKENYRSVVENSDDCICVWLPDTTLTYVNQSYCNYFGINEEEVLGKSFLEFLPENIREEIMSQHQNIINEPSVYRREHEVIGSNGRIYWQEWVNTPIFNEDGSLMGFHSIGRDVTGYKLLEEELTTSFRQLDLEIRTAEEVYSRILPQKLPEPEGVSVAAYFRPANRMGGDSYNVIKIGGKLIIYLADVMGHGLDGALLSVFIKKVIDSYVDLKPDDISPQKIINYLSWQYYREEYPKGQLVCIFLGVLDLKTMEFTYTSAGMQNMPLVRWGNGERGKLDCHGLFISTMVPFEDYDFEERSVTLTPGTTILFSTDGLTEQSNDKSWFYQHYEDVFLNYSDLPPEAIVQAINKVFFRFNNNTIHNNDDITYLVLQVDPYKKEKHHMEINSRVEEAVSVYKKVKDITANFSAQNDLLTGLHELVVNAMEHGNKFDPNKKVSVDLTVTPAYVLAEVEDEGPGFNWYEKIDQPINVSDFTERGRGIPLTQMLGAYLYYNQRGNRAILLVRSIKGGKLSG